MSTLTLRTGSVRGHAAAAPQPAHYPAPITLNRTLSLRAALFALLVFAGLLAGLNLVSHLLLAPGTPPVDLRANLAFYADYGFPIQFCETGRAGIAGLSRRTATTSRIRKVRLGVASFWARVIIFRLP